MSGLEAIGTIAASFAICMGTSFLPIGGGVEVYLLAGVSGAKFSIERTGS
jgi:hypothetical protein